MASTDSSCAPLLNVPLASTVPSAPSATANGLPGTSAACPLRGVLDLVERAQHDARVRAEALHGGREDPAQAAALGGEDRESDPVGRELERLEERALRADLRALVGDLERAGLRDREPQHPDLARERQHDDARARRSRSAPPTRPIVSHSSVVGSLRGRTGASANAAASSAARPAEAFPTLPLAPKHAHGAPVRPARIAATCAAAAPAISSAAALAASALPAPTAIAEHQLDRDQRAPHGLRLRRVRTP